MNPGVPRLYLQDTISSMRPPSLPIHTEQAALVSWRSMKKTKPINTTSDGRAYLKSMTGGGGYYPCTGVLEIIETDSFDANKALEIWTSE